MIKSKMRTIAQILSQILILVLLLMIGKGQVCGANLPTNEAKVAPAKSKPTLQLVFPKFLIEEAEEVESDNDGLNNEEDSLPLKPFKCYWIATRQSTFDFNYTVRAQLKQHGHKRYYYLSVPAYLSYHQLRN